MGQNGPRKFMLAWVIIKGVSPSEPGVHASTAGEVRVKYEPWSCSASGAVAARKSEIRRTLPRHENPYLDSERIATP
jgi:hypothetical protein